MDGPPRSHRGSWKNAGHNKMLCLKFTDQDVISMTLPDGVVIFIRRYADRSIAIVAPEAVSVARLGHLTNDDFNELIGKTE